MDGDLTAISLPDDPRWAHGLANGVGGVKIHYVREGRGDPVLLLHGWPGFWYDWRRVIPALSAHADVLAPDFRGFGASDKPDVAPTEAYTPDVLAADMLALLDHLGLEAVVVAGHDIGASIAQVLARTAPTRVRALVLCNPPYPGIGMRRFEPAAQAEAWYQHLHALPWADQLIGHDHETVRLYLAHFYDHWMGHKEALHPQEFAAIVDTFAQPDAVRGSIAYYKARAGARLREATADPADLRIEQPTMVLWGEADPVVRVAWADRLPDYFPQLTLRRLPDVGHFVPVEAPGDVIKAIQTTLAAVR